MATITCEIYDKYWPNVVKTDLAAALRDLLDRRGLTSATVTVTPLTNPSRQVVSISGVPPQVIVTHQDVVDRINNRIGLTLSY